MTRIFSILTLILAIVLFPPAALALISNNAVPGDFTYPVKRGLEAGIVKIASITPITRAWFSVERSSRRFRETTALIAKGGSFSKTLDELVDQTEVAAKEVAKVKSPAQKQELIAKLSESIKKYDEGLVKAEQQLETNQVPQPAPSAISRPQSIIIPQPRVAAQPTTSAAPAPGSAVQTTNIPQVAVPTSIPALPTPTPIPTQAPTQVTPANTSSRREVEEARRRLAEIQRRLEEEQDRGRGRNDNRGRSEDNRSESDNHRESDDDRNDSDRDNDSNSNRGNDDRGNDDSRGRGREGR